MDILIGDYAEQSSVISHLIKMSGKDYSTILHSINVMAFAMTFASHFRFSKEETRLLGLCPLLHDVGKTKADMDILHAPRKLKNDERPYRSALEAFDALNNIVGKDVRNGKFNVEIYTQFVKSLGKILK